MRPTIASLCEAGRVVVSSRSGSTQRPRSKRTSPCSTRCSASSRQERGLPAACWCSRFDSSSRLGASSKTEANSAWVSWAASGSKRSGSADLANRARAAGVRGPGSAAAAATISSCARSAEAANMASSAADGSSTRSRSSTATSMRWVAQRASTSCCSCSSSWPRPSASGRGAGAPVSRATRDSSRSSAMSSSGAVPPGCSSSCANSASATPQGPGAWSGLLASTLSPESLARSETSARKRVRPRPGGAVTRIDVPDARRASRSRCCSTRASSCARPTRAGVVR